MTAERVDALMPFYVDVLGFRLTDYILAPFKAFFFHVNPRHHSLAMIETGRNGLHHVMVELYSLDDVGQAYDIALGEPERVGVTLGRHTNDFMTSFYAKTPSAFMVECGWGGREIAPAQWQPQEYTEGPGVCGVMRRTWLYRRSRSCALPARMRLQAAADGMRRPVQVIEGNYQRMSGACPWWDGVAQATGRTAAPAERAMEDQPHV